MRPGAFRAAAALRAAKKDDSWKKWHGKEEWKNWIAWDAPHQSPTDQMNRRRHYFYRVDAKGRLIRLEFDQPCKTFGEIKATGRDWRQVDYFFSHLGTNDTEQYLPEYEWMSTRMHEKYFVKCDIAPIVFNDLRDGELKYGATLTQKFDLRQLRLSAAGHLHHAVDNKAGTLFGVLESQTAQPLLECIEMTNEGNDEDTRFELLWKDASRTSPVPAELQ